MKVIDISGDGRLMCKRCELVSPSFYPSCPTCCSTEFVGIAVEPKPPILLTSQFFRPYRHSRPDSVASAMYESRAIQLINSFENKGYFLTGDRGIIVRIQDSFRFSPTEVTRYLARYAARGRFFSPSSFLLCPLPRSNLPSDSSHYRISYRPDSFAIRSAAALYCQPSLPPPAASILHRDNIPDPDMELLCAICQRPEEGFDEDNCDEEDYFFDFYGLADRRSFRVLRTSCSHAFHRTCISNWFENGRLDCPCCRRIVLTVDDQFNLWAARYNATLG